MVRIHHLLFWTAATAGVLLSRHLTFSRAVDSGTPAFLNDFAYTVLAWTFLIVQSMIDGATFVGGVLVVRQRIRDLTKPNAPGHWILLASLVNIVAELLLSVTRGLWTNGASLGGFELVGFVGVALSMAVIYGLAALRSSWARFFYAAAALPLVCMILELAMPLLDLPNSILVWIPQLLSLSLVGWVICLCMHDMRLGRSYDGLHRLGVSVMVIASVVSFAWLIVEHVVLS